MDKDKRMVDILNDIKREEDQKWEDDVVLRVIKSLLAIEKKSLYGSYRGKNKELDKIITNEIKNYLEQAEEK